MAVVIHGATRFQFAAYFSRCRTETEDDGVLCNADPGAHRAADGVHISVHGNSPFRWLRHRATADRDGIAHG